MKAIASLLVTIALVALPVSAPAAGADKTLTNIKGAVTYQAPGGAAQKLAPKASLALNDNDAATTLANSEASITLPDSSRVLIGQNSRVQLVSFNQATIATAKFIVLGKARFAVQHPNGARANYTFQTATGQIAVRGTEGDINSSPTNLQVNVYQVSNPNLPVQVTLNDGRVFTLNQGQALVVHTVAGSLSAAVGHVSEQMFKPFSEFGAPANSANLGLSATAAAHAAILTPAVTTAAAAVAVPAAVIAVSNASKPAAPTPSPTPTVAPTASPTLPPTPAPTPTSTSVPITIQQHGANGAPPTPGPMPTPPTPPVPGPPGPPVPHPGVPGGIVPPGHRPVGPPRPPRHMAAYTLFGNREPSITEA